jgi:hypothetical protein
MINVRGSEFTFKDKLCSVLSVLPCHCFNLLEVIAIHHGDFVNDQVVALSPLLSHLRSSCQLDTLFQITLARPDACTIS